MYQEKINRRKLLALGAVAAGTSLPSLSQADDTNPLQQEQDASPTSGGAIRYCLNYSTIRGKRLTMPEFVDLAADVGYDAIEPWIGEIRRYIEGGGQIEDLRQQIEDAGLEVASAIGFAHWIVDDENDRAAAFDTMRSDMLLLRSIGGRRIAASPAGATRGEPLDLRDVAVRYHALLELGRETEIVPQLEIWGPSKTLHSLSELLFAAVESGHPDACLLPDVYHIYRGGSDFSALRLINGRAIHVFHMNDYPGDVPRDQQTDAHRVFPGDGIAPLGAMIRDLVAAGFAGIFSLELFNRDYWERNLTEVVREGLRKMRESVHEALETS